MSKDSNNNSKTPTGIIASSTSIEEIDLEEEKRRKNRQDVIYIGATNKPDTAHIGGKNTYDNTHITAAPSTTSSNTKKQHETTGGGALLGTASGIGIGIAAGLAMGPLAPIAVPAFAIAGYFAGMYTGNAIEAGLRGLSEGTFTDRLKDFGNERLKRIDRTIGGGLGLGVGIFLASLIGGPASLIAAPFLAFYCNRIGAEILERATPTLLNAYEQTKELINGFKSLFKSKDNSKQDIDLSKEANKSTSTQTNNVAAISSHDLKQAENIIKNTELSNETSKTSLPNAPKPTHRSL